MGIQINGATDTISASDGSLSVTSSESIFSGIATFSDGVNLTGPSLIEVNSSSNALRITQTGSGNVFLAEDQTNPDGSPFVITGSGDVGIGLTNPQTSLVVERDWVNNYGSINIKSSSDVLSGIGFRTDGGYAGGFIYRDGTTGNFFELNAQGSRDIRALLNGSEALRITSSGNFGIGTTNPQAKLHVDGNSLVTGYSKVGGWVTKTWSLASPPNGTSVQHIIHSTTANNINFINGELIILPLRSGLNQQRGYVKYAISYSFYQGALYGFITELERTGVLGFSNLTLTTGVVSGTTANTYINATSDTAALGSISVKFEGILYGY